MSEAAHHHTQRVQARCRPAQRLHSVPAAASQRQSVHSWRPADSPESDEARGWRASSPFPTRPGIGRRPPPARTLCTRVHSPRRGSPQTLPASPPQPCRQQGTRRPVRCCPPRPRQSSVCAQRPWQAPKRQPPPTLPPARAEGSAPSRPHPRSRPRHHHDRSRHLSRPSPSSLRLPHPSHHRLVHPRRPPRRPCARSPPPPPCHGHTRTHEAVCPRARGRPTQHATERTSRSAHILFIRALAHKPHEDFQAHDAARSHRGGPDIVGPCVSTNFKSPSPDHAEECHDGHSDRDAGHGERGCGNARPRSHC